MSKEQNNVNKCLTGFAEFVGGQDANEDVHPEES